MFILIGKRSVNLLVLDKSLELHERDVPLSECLLGCHLCDLHVAFALLSLGGLQIEVANEVTPFGDISLDCLPRLSYLIVAMMFRKIK